MSDIMEDDEHCCRLEGILGEISSFQCFMHSNIATYEALAQNIGVIFVHRTEMVFLFFLHLQILH